MTPPEPDTCVFCDGTGHICMGDHDEPCAWCEPDPTPTEEVEGYLRHPSHGGGIPR